jgi:hypothetical protein
MVKNLFLFFLITQSLFLNAQKSNPFAKIKFDSLVIYSYEGKKDTDLLIVDKNNKLTKLIKKSAKLGYKESVVLTQKLGSATSYGEGTSACFIPHLGIVYYKSGSVVRHVSVCLDCNRLRADVAIPAQDQKKYNKSAKEYYVADGLSKSFRHLLGVLLRKYNFPAPAY